MLNKYTLENLLTQSELHVLDAADHAWLNAEPVVLERIDSVPVAEEKDLPFELLMPNSDNGS